MQVQAHVDVRRARSPNDVHFDSLLGLGVAVAEGGGESDVRVVTWVRAATVSGVVGLG